MGRVKTSHIKNLAKVLAEKYKDRFTDDFKHNKEVLKELGVGESQKIRNKLAGYIVRIVRLRKF